ncbi:hypothetical protein HU200_000230 [Digitaria exilis]|uniref:Haloacid dehalogenase-like hydrolase domain-containing protein 3 n=1 Tax=Digitaria exilis TaxID=1010633 RepID=A0A835G0R0_9POAL|nr:hypothetical protein HU200_000230 [Digitaria exilis]
MCCCGGGHHLSPQSIMSSSSLLSKLRLVTVDVTGTLIAYKGQLGDYYCMSAKSAGMPCPDYKRVHEGFKLAYADMSRRHPCFGHAAAVPTAQWWKMCVRDSFARAGYEYDDDTFERIFRRIYATFGSSAPYSVFPDAHGFLRWLRGKGLLVGVVSNAEHRYRDVVLPALGLNQGSEWDFGVFSGVVGVEKPDTRIYEAAMEAAGGVAAGEALHIGDSLRKDYAPARSLGMHALLLDRFGTEEAGRWRRSGVPVLPDLVAARRWLVAGAGDEAAEDQCHTARHFREHLQQGPPAPLLWPRCCFPSSSVSSSPPSPSLTGNELKTNMNLSASSKSSSSSSLAAVSSGVSSHSRASGSSSTSPSEVEYQSGLAGEVQEPTVELELRLRVVAPTQQQLPGWRRRRLSGRGFRAREGEESADA